jgi:hypothetical protein
MIARMTASGRLPSEPPEVFAECTWLTCSPVRCSRPPSAGPQLARGGRCTWCAARWLAPAERGLAESGPRGRQPRVGGHGRAGRRQLRRLRPRWRAGLPVPTRRRQQPGRGTCGEIGGWRQRHPRRRCPARRRRGWRALLAARPWPHPVPAPAHIREPASTIIEAGNPEGSGKLWIRKGPRPRWQPGHKR